MKTEKRELSEAQKHHWHESTMNNNRQVDLLIIGSGPAAYTAAIYAARAALNPLVVGGVLPGGQLMNTTVVENWPGDISIMGPELVKRFREHAAHYGTTFINEDVVEADLERLVFTTHKGTAITAQAVIIATGAAPKQLGVSGEEEYWGKGVTTCAVCDGALYKDRPVLVVGGGDSAMENASFLSRFTKEITIVQNGAELTASRIMAKRVLNNADTNIIYDHTVKQISGDGEKVTQVLIEDLETGKQQAVHVDGVFVSIGLKPNTDLFVDQLDLSPSGHIILKEHTMTSRSGVFAAGDVADARYRQAITASGTGCAAALDAERYLMEQDS